MLYGLIGLIWGLIWLSCSLVAAALLVTPRHRARSVTLFVAVPSGFVGSCGLSIALINAVDIGGYGPWWGSDFGISLWLASLVLGAGVGAMIGPAAARRRGGAYRFSQLVIQRRFRSIRSR